VTVVAGGFGNIEIELSILYRMKTYSKELISPLIEDAFSEPVLHRVVLSNIDFELPDEIWYEINEGFSFYWDEEVGFGNDVYFDSACQSIQKHLNSVGVLYPYDKLGIILEILFDFIGQIPGVYLDESDIVIPKQRKENHDESIY
jgi:hypothetical protein